jgi:lysophospholipase L1-like esterase
MLAVRIDLISRWATALWLLVFVCIPANARGAGDRFALLIGDSHGASPTGWASQLMQKRADISFVNTCVSGNTIGFDNLNSERLNTLENIGRYVQLALDSSRTDRIDDVVILLGTNDCKAVFAQRQEEVPVHLTALIDSVRMLTAGQQTPPVIYIVSPPPYGPDDLLPEKYSGAGARLMRLIPAFMEVALTKDCAFVDVYNPLLPHMAEYTTDGVHLTVRASRQIADAVSTYFDAHGRVEGDDTRRLLRDPRMREVGIISSADSTVQPCFHYPSSAEIPKPLIVRLHSWSGDYTQHDPLAEEIINKDWNYIFPNFRGANNTPQACGSPLVVQDIDDAIRFAIDHGRVDPDNIHIVGSSGGGHATLLMYMRSACAIRTFSAWVPISDIEAWYHQSRGRNNKYAVHILLATGSEEGALDIDEMRSRSPYFMQTPVELRKDARLYLYAGIHDGYTGSVPISQSIKMYNKLVADMGGDPQTDGIDCSTTLDLVTMRTAIEPPDRQLGKREVLLYRDFGPVSIIIFEGTHEMLKDVVLNRLEK